jgi:hypothetical protein
VRQASLSTAWLSWGWLRWPRPVERRRRLEEMHSMYAFLEHELPLLMQRWEAECKDLLDAD